MDCMGLRHDRRGQSVVIGSVLIFGILIIALSLYQVQVVPQQNAQVEFEHFESVQDDLIDLRAGIATAGQADTPQFKTVRLGTAYPRRVVAINPPAPAGSIQTSESYPIRISNESVTRTVPTRFIRYDPGYNELQPTPIWYDASVIYVDARTTGGGAAIIEDEQLVTDSGTVRLTAIQNEFQQQGTGRVTLELYPTADPADEPFPTGNLTVDIPTRLTGPEYWDTADIPADTYDGVTPDAYASGVNELTLTTTDDAIRVNTVGIQTEPTEQAAKRNIQRGSGTGGDNGENGDGGSDAPPLDFRTLEENEDGDLEFTAQNIAGESVIITDFSVDATSLANNPRLNNDDDPEVAIEPQDSGQPGSANRVGGGTNGRYEADGTGYPLDTEVTLGNQEEAEISFNGLRSQNGDRLQFELTRTADADNADVTIVLQFSSDNRPAQEFYFEDIS